MKRISRLSSLGTKRVLRFSSYLDFEVAKLVLIKWLINGHRLEERVPLSDARHRKYELEAQGAIIYWSERTYV